MKSLCLMMLVAVVCVVVTGCGSDEPSVASPTFSYNVYDTDAMVLAEYHVWHGLPSHSSAFAGEPLLPNERPYDSRDADVISRHILEAKRRGISGFVVNWYGPKDGVANDEDREFMDQATEELFRQAEEKDFLIALIYDEGTVSKAEPDTSTYVSRVQTDLLYADRYFSSSAYLAINGHPAVFVFSYEDVDPFLDWSQIRDNLSTSITLIDKDPNPDDPDHDSCFDGFYAWVQATRGEWDAEGQEWGQEYLEWFYATMHAAPYADKVMIGGVWPGFDDSPAPWSQNRYMSRMGNTTHERTLQLAEQNKAPYIMVGTWNDFEEGTDIEYGVRMIVDTESPYPELLLRSSPVKITWGADQSSAVVQVYRNGELIFDRQHAPGVHLSLATGNIFELKLWVPGASSPFSVWIKIRHQDPIPDVVPVVVD